VGGNTNVYAFTGNPVNPFGTLVATFNGPSVYNNPSLLINATPPPPVTVNFSLVGSVLTMTPTPTFIGQFQVTVNVTDGMATTTKAFLVTVN
jgi:hypothetical protein